MKNNRNQILLTLSVCAVFLFTATSCRKDPQEVVELISNSEAAEIIETAVSERMAGFTMPTIDMEQLLESYLQNCGTPGDTTIQKSKNGGLTSYTYTFNMEWLVNCNNLGLPLDATTSVAGSGNFHSPNWDGADQTSGNLTFTGLGAADPDYIANGTYKLTGDLTGNLRRTNPSFNCVTELTLTNLTINKTSDSVTGGNGTAKITATASNGASREVNGTLVFNGDGTVTVTVNGYTHTFQVQ